MRLLALSAGLGWCASHRLGTLLCHMHTTSGSKLSRGQDSSFGLLGWKVMRRCMWLGLLLGLGLGLGLCLCQGLGLER